MTPEQFWHGDVWLAPAYRKAFEMTENRRERDLWLQGRYYYDALCAVAPVLVSLPKHGAKIQPYPEEPYAFTLEKAEKMRIEKEKKQYEKMKDKTASFAERFNANFMKQGGGSDGSRD